MAKRKAMRRKAQTKRKRTKVVKKVRAIAKRLRLRSSHSDEGR